MSDITFCSPTRLKKRCATCYRRILIPNEMQSWSNFYDECDDYYIKAVTPEEYEKTMDDIIKKGKDNEIQVTMMMLLERAAKLHLVNKKGTHGKPRRNRNKSNDTR